MYCLSAFGFTFSNVSFLPSSNVTATLLPLVSVTLKVGISDLSNVAPLSNSFVKLKSAVFTKFISL